jgi:hypothetical protein
MSAAVIPGCRLIDKYFPRSVITEIHEMRVDAPPAVSSPGSVLVGLLASTLAAGLTAWTGGPIGHPELRPGAPPNPEAPSRPPSITFLASLVPAATISVPPFYSYLVRVQLTRRANPQPTRLLRRPNEDGCPPGAARSPAEPLATMTGRQR